MELSTKTDPAITKAAKALGKKGGLARSSALTPERRSEIARLAADARWNKDIQIKSK